MNDFLSVLDCRNELARILHEQNSILAYMNENNLVPEHTASKPLVIDTKNLPEMQKVLEGEAYKLQNFDVVISVVGTMKAGKSTTINAIVGKKVLPSRNRPMTTLPTLICHQKGQKVPRLKLNTQKIDELIQRIKLVFQEYPEILKNPEIKTLQSESDFDVIHRLQSGDKFKSEVDGSEDIFYELEYLNDIARILGILTEQALIESHVVQTFYDSYKEVSALPTISVEFESLSKIKADFEGRLMLLDTPGPNEVDQPQLKAILEQQLKRSSAVLLVLDYTQLKSEAEHGVREQVEKIPTIEKERLYVVVNKFDQKNSDSDDREKTIDIVEQDLLRDRVKREYVFPISAQGAFLAQRMLSYCTYNSEKPDVNEGWVQDFFGDKRKAERALKRSDLEEIKIEAEEELEDSFIMELLENAINKAFVNAPQIAIYSAMANSRKIFEDLSNVFAIGGYFLTRIKLNEEELAKIEKTVIELEISQKKLEESREEAQKEIGKLADEIGKSILIELDQISERITNEIEQINESLISEKSERIQEIKDELKLTINFFSKKRKKLLNELSVLRAGDNASTDIQKEILFFSLDEKINYEKIVENFYRDLIAESNDAGNQLIKLGEERVRSELKLFEKLYIEKINDIKRNFSNANIKLDITIPTLDEKLNVNFSNTLELSRLNLSREEKTTVDRGGFWASILRSVDFFGADWGKDEKDCYLYDNRKLIQNLKENFRREIIPPLKEESERVIDIYGNQLITIYTKEIEEQTASLINELKVAIENEQKPVEYLKEQKEFLSIVIQRNNSMKDAIKELEKAIEWLFSSNKELEA